MQKTTFTINKQALEVVMERVFGAPRELVWQTLTDPKILPQWWGPGILTTTVEKDEVKVGGGWRYIQKDPKGNVFAFHGEYLEVLPPEKLSRTFNFEGIPGDHELVETAMLEDLKNGTTKVTSIAKYRNIEDLEGMVNSGMKGGATESWERLAKLVEKN